MGKFGVLLKIVADYMSSTQTGFDGRNMTGPRKAKAQVHPLPVEEPDFKWRVRADLKQALNIPQDRMDTEPSTYVELGWKEHPSQVVEHGNKVFSVLIEGSQYPDFN